MSRIRFVASLLIVTLVCSLALAGGEKPCPLCRDSEPFGSGQIQIRLLMADVDRDRLQEFGVCLEKPGNTNAVSSVLSILPHSSIQSTPLAATHGGMTHGKIKDAGECRGFLDALAKVGAATIVSRPRLVTFNGRTASIGAGGQLPVVIPRPDGSTMTEVLEFGFKIDLLPLAQEPGRIRLELRPELSELDYCNGVVAAGQLIPGIQRRRLDLSASLAPGEALVLGSIHETSDCVVQERLTRGCAFFASWTAGGVTWSPVPIPAKLCGAAMINAPQSHADCRRHEKELIIIAAADVLQPVDRANETSAACRRDEWDAQIVPAGLETDADQPHPPAVLLNEVAPCPTLSSPCERPLTRNVIIRVDDVTKDCPGICGYDDVDFREASGSHSGSRCCREAKRAAIDGIETLPGCCRREIEIHRIACDANGDDDDDDDGDAANCFVENVLAAQTQYLELMMRARLHHEQSLLEAKTTVEIALAKKDAEHAQAIATLRVEHAVEMEKARAALWEVERRSLDAQHRQALEHQRELADVRRDHLQEMQAQRLMSLENELRELRVRLAAGQPAGAAHVTILPGVAEQRHSTTAVHTKPEITVRVEDLQSGRVRYGAGQSSGPQPAGPRDAVEPVEFSTPPLSAGRKQTDDATEMRREIARLRTLVEELLCVTAESPPVPIPHKPDDDDSDR